MIKNKDKGITLIALVITIIVLLILAGVAISMLSGENGILKRAAEAKEKTEEAQKQEETTLTDYELISHFTLNNSKYKCKHGFITGVSTTGDDGGPKNTELASNLVKALPEGYFLHDITIDPNNNYKITVEEEAIEKNDEVIKLKTGMAIKKDNKLVAKVVVFGDLTSEGIVDATDKGYLYVFTMSKGLNKRFPQDESFYIAMDVNHNGIIDLQDSVDLNNAMNSASSDNPTIIYQNVDAKKIEKIVFPEE